MPGIGKKSTAGTNKTSCCPPKRLLTRGTMIAVVLCVLVIMVEMGVSASPSQPKVTSPWQSSNVLQQAQRVQREASPSTATKTLANRAALSTAGEESDLHMARSSSSAVTGRFFLFKGMHWHDPDESESEFNPTWLTPTFLSPLVSPLRRPEEVYVASFYWIPIGEDRFAGTIFAQHSWLLRQDRGQGPLLDFLVWPRSNGRARGFGF